MDVFTLALNFLQDKFILTIIIIVLILIVSGIILLIRNIRPILGLLLMIFALALIIGVSYDADGIKRELNKFWSKMNKENTQIENTDTE